MVVVMIVLHVSMLEYKLFTGLIVLFGSIDLRTTKATPMTMALEIKNFLIGFEDIYSERGLHSVNCKFRCFR